MKKYTQRLKQHIHGWRVAKNWAALLVLLANALNTLITKGSITIVVESAITAFLIIVLGETIHHLGMSWIETAESIQEKNETI